MKIPTHSNTLVHRFNEALSKVPEKGVLQGSRRFTKGRRGKRICFFPSVKNSVLHPCESTLEADNCLDLELSSSITKYITQAPPISLGGRSSYTGDSLHRGDHGNLVVREVKFSGTLEDASLLERLDRVKSILKRNGIGFEVKTEKSLRRYPQIYNRKYLYKVSHQKFLDVEIDQVKKELSYFQKNHSETITLRRLRCICSELGLSWFAADYMLLNNFAGYNETLKLTPDSEVWIEGEIS